MQADATSNYLELDGLQKFLCIYLELCCMGISNTCTTTILDPINLYYWMLSQMLALMC